jgi:hypothetical protein
MPLPWPVILNPSINKKYLNQQAGQKEQALQNSDLFCFDML